jgi:hypothetical protein
MSSTDPLEMTANLQRALRHASQEFGSAGLPILSST